MTNDNRLISVIMGVYNCAPTLRFAIDSILAQTYTDWEFIICDDCSTDETYAICKEYAARYPDKFIVIQNERNSKLAYSLNQCLAAARGYYIARMDGDDISVPERFAEQVDYLKEHPDIDLVGTGVQRFSDKGFAEPYYLIEHPDKYCMRDYVAFAHATIMTYKRVYDALGGYTVCKRTERGQDYDLWFRFFAAGFRGYNIQKPLYYVREDMAAIKRRTFKVRYRAFQTTKYGYKLLNYPKWWIVRPAIALVAKSLTPYRLVGLYRKYQAARAARKGV